MGLDLEVVIDLNDYGFSSRTSGGNAIWETARWIVPSDYDNATWYFEIVGRNSHASNAYNVYLTNFAGTVISTITIPANTPTSSDVSQRFRSTSFAMSSSDYYLLSIDLTASLGNLTVSAVRIVVVQVNATKTCIPIPMCGNNGSLTAPPSSNPISYIVGTTWNQQVPQNFSLFKKDISEFADIGGWRLDATHSAFYGGGTHYSEVGLWNVTSGAIVPGTVISYNGNTPTPTHLDFDNTVSGFDNLSTFEIRHHNSYSGDASYLYSAQLYVRLVNLSVATLRKRIARGITVSTGGANQFITERILGGNSATSCLETVGYRTVVGLTQYVTNAGASDAGYSGSNIDQSAVVPGTVKAIQRSLNFVVSGTRRYYFASPGTTGATLVLSSALIVESVKSKEKKFWLFSLLDPATMLPDVKDTLGVRKGVLDQKLSCRLRRR
jgi:hypothetical protein